MSKWTRDLVIETAKKYTTRHLWAKSDRPSYKAAQNNGWLEEASSHMPKMASLRWTKETIAQDALKFNSKSEWMKSGSYKKALKLGLVDLVSSHMKKNEKWTKERVLEDSKRYKTRSEWKLSSRAYDSAVRNGWLEEACAHMESRVWTMIEAIEDAKKYRTVSEWQTARCSAYNSAYRNGWLSECTQHMTREVGSSRAEKDILSIIRSEFPKAHSTYFKNNDPNCVAKRFQLDIYIPELRKGIEFDGTYWHSFEGLKRGRPSWGDSDIKNYHAIKDNFFKSRGIQVIYINERDWKLDKSTQIGNILEFLKS